MTGTELVELIEDAGGPAAYERVMAQSCDQWSELGAEVAQLMHLAVSGRLRYGAGMLVRVMSLLKGPTLYRVMVGGREVDLYDWGSFGESMERLSFFASLDGRRVVCGVCRILEAWSETRSEMQEDMLRRLVG